MAVAAISLELSFPEEVISIESVTLGKDSRESVLFNCWDGKLKISWYSLESIIFNRDDVLLNIFIRVNREMEDINSTIRFKIFI